MTSVNDMKGSRPTLAAQIDRLDAVLDGLSGSLEDTVADAVRQAAALALREAVAAGVRDALADPALIREALARHAPAATPRPAKHQHSLLGSAWETLGRLTAMAADRACDAASAVGSACSW